MQLEDYFDFQAPGDIRIKGHRIGIENVLYEYINRDQTPEEIAARFPTLSLEHVYATILYYLHNKDAVHAYMTEWIEHGERMWREQQKNPTPTDLKIRKMRAMRAEARRRALYESLV